VTRLWPRLLFAVLPSAVGILLVAALAYWGQYQRALPHLYLGIAIVAVGASLVISWHNARHIAELDVMKGVADHLSDAVTTARVEGERRERAASARAAEYGFLLETLTGSVATQIEQVQLPLHVLLASRFGELNENQEEMIEAARRAADEADSSIRSTRRILEMDAGQSARSTREPVHPVDLVQAARAIAAARAERRNVSLVIEVTREMPRVIGDRYQLEEALSAILCAAVDRTPDSGTVTVGGSESGDRLTLEIRSPGAPQRSLDTLLGARLVAAQQGDVQEEEGLTRITLPAERLRRAGTPA
jgi:signal transduction histidine kinase